MGIFKNDSIYKSGGITSEDIERIFNDNFVELHCKVLDKYKPYVNYVNFESENATIYNKLTQIFLFAQALQVTSTFTPYYSSSDPAGDTDWPLFAYFEIPNTNRQSFFFPFKEYGSMELNLWELTSYEDGIIGLRMTKNRSLVNGYHFFLGGAMQLRA